MDKTSLLIDFSSPAQKHNSSPLIPVPPQTSVSPSKTNELSNDPFEVPEIESVSPDPFESVLKRAINNSMHEKDEKAEQESSTSNNEENVNKSFKSENSEDVNQIILKMEDSAKKCDTIVLSNNDNLVEEIPLECNKDPLRNKIPANPKQNPKVLPSTSPVENTAETTENTSKSSALQENDNQSQVSADFSTEESLKAVIAKRVNKCIQEVLNGSVRTNNSNQSPSKKPQNKRSLSFVGLSSLSNKKECERLNKSWNDCNETFNLENQEFCAPDSSNESSDFRPLSPHSAEVSTEENTEEQVFKEARKLSRTFSKLAQSFNQKEESDDDDGDDLMSCKPRWLYTDSSEDEEEKLLKDPALNFRRRSNTSVQKSESLQPSSVLDSPALVAYKTRRSYTQLQVNTTQEELTLKRSNSIGSKLKEIPIIPPLVAAVSVNIVKPDDQPIKLKRNMPGDKKKGPMRAVMPIQSMTKEPLYNEGKLSTQQETSPELRMQRSMQMTGTPNKFQDSSQLNMTPVASSTPNKAENSMCNGKASLLKPAIQVPTNKRHSLEGSTSHKSRPAMADPGVRPRSNSANSSIPRVMQVKPQKGMPLMPKSTSNLSRSSNVQANSRNVNVSEKKNISQTKSSFNSRALTEVKTKSPRQGKMKTAVSTISKLVTGRGKKAATHDKENRFPV